MRTTFSVVNNSFLLKAGSERIRSGDILSVKIIENNNGLIRALVKGKIIGLKGPENLKINSIIKVRAQWNGNSLVLSRIDEKSSFTKWIADSGLKDSPAALMMFEAVQRAGGSLSGDTIRLLRRLLRKNKELNKEESRTAAEVIKKGLSAEEMISITGWRNQDREKNNDKTILFNHIADLDELWFIIPYSFSAEDVESEGGLNGSIRIRKNIRTKEILSAVIEITAGCGRYFFLIRNYNGKNRNLRLFVEGTIPQAHKKQIKQILPEILGNLLIKFDDNIIEDCFDGIREEVSFDGFSVTESALKGVEEVI